MAIVKSEALIITGQNFKRKIKCSSEGVFTCELPSWIVEDLSMDPAYPPRGDSLDDCLAKWGDIIRQYENRQTSTKKVICFKVDTDLSFSDGVALSVSAGVFNETVTTFRGKDGRFNYELQFGELPAYMSKGLRPGFRGERYDSQIPWTQEAEDYLRDLGEAMTHLTERLESLTEPQALIDFINNGGKLLTGPTDRGSDNADN